MSNNLAAASIKRYHLSMHTKIYTDGGCKPNPGPGGWGAVIRFQDHEWTLSGNDPDTTNNQMELQAAIAALTLLQSTHGRCEIELFTDSEYLRQGITSWVENWERNGWQTKDQEPVKNQELWQRLHDLIHEHEIAWHWLKGHDGHPHNERADQLATQAREALTAPKLAPPPTMISGETAEVDIFVKASYNPSRQEGSWGVVLRKGDHLKTVQGRQANASANALLLVGTIQGLQALTRPCAVAIHSDADYLIRGATQWIKGWLARGWRTKDGKPVANREGWEALLAATRPHRTSWHLTKPEDSPDLASAGELASGDQPAESAEPSR